MDILVADDDPAIRAILSAALKGDGRRMLEAEDGARAWDLVRAEKPNLVISDWRMPGVEGPELCRRIRERRGEEYTYFVLMTAAGATPRDYAEASLSEVDDFLIKPLDPAQIRLRARAAQRLLAYANRLRELETIVPVCADCRRVRDDRNSYQQMETYFARHAGVLFSHGICPECLAKR